MPAIDRSLSDLLTTLLQDFDKQVAPYLQPPDLLTTSTPAVDPEAEGDLFSAAVEARGDDSGGGDSAVAGMVSKKIEFCTKNEELCI